MTSGGLPVFAPPHIGAEARDDGTVVLQGDDLAPYAPSMAHLFRAGAAAHPERVLATQPSPGGRSSLTWGEAREQADAIAQSLLDRGLGLDRPLSSCRATRSSTWCSCSARSPPACRSCR